MKGLLETPDSIQLQILEVSDPRDIRICRLVCRALYDLIVSSPHIQYILALDSLGYTMPSVPRLDLTPRQKVELLERHRRNWSSPGSLQFTEYALPVREHRYDLDKYNGGVYARALALDEPFGSNNRRIVGILFRRFPSPNLGLEFKEWSIPDFGLVACGIEFDTAQDLLVLVELVDPGRSWTEGCRIHLRTMDDNSQHPKAVVPFLLAEFTHSEGDLAGNLRVAPITFDIEVVGNVLAVLFKSRIEQVASWVVVWDWHRAEEVMRVSTGTWQAASSFTMLSHNTFLLPRNSKSYYVQEDIPDDTCGSLDVYIFDPDATTSTPPRMTASFELPKLDARDCLSTLRINGGQPPKPPSTCPDTRPKVYEPAGQERLIAVAVWLRSLTYSSETYIHQYELLYVPSSLLRSQTPQVIPGENDAVTKIPWDTWAPLVSWRSGEESGNHWTPALYGQRLAFIATLPGVELDQPTDETEPEVVLFDFNQRRVRLVKSNIARDSERPKGAMSVNPSRGRRGSYSRGRGRGRGRGGTDDQGVFRPQAAMIATKARLEKMFCEAQVKTASYAWPLPRRPGPGYTTHSVTIDDEHVIVQKTEHDSDMEGIERNHLVYTFG